MKTSSLLVCASLLLSGIFNPCLAHSAETLLHRPQALQVRGDEHAHLGYVVGFGINEIQAKANAEAKMWNEIAKICSNGWTLVSFEIHDEGALSNMEYFIEFEAVFTSSR